MGREQMGQRCEVSFVGAGTVRMGSKEELEIGGSMRRVLSEVEVGRFKSPVVPFSETLEVVDCCCCFGGPVSRVDVVFGRKGKIGGGRSIFSAAFLDNCLAKSEACHHSRNFSAKILVGNRILSEARSLGYTLLAIFLGLKIEPPSPGLAGPIFAGAVANSIAL